MNLPPDKVRLLRQYDNEKKWELICDQVRACDDIRVTERERITNNAFIFIVPLPTLRHHPKTRQNLIIILVTSHLPVNKLISAELMSTVGFFIRSGCPPDTCVAMVTVTSAHPWMPDMGGCYFVS